MRRLLAMNLAVLLLPAAWTAAAETETDYYAVMVADQKVGHMVRERTVDGEKVTSREKIVTTVLRNGSEVEMVIETINEETTAGKPLGFETISKDSNSVTRTVGRRGDDGRWTVTQETAGQTRTMTADYPSEALMPEGERLAARSHQFASGTHFTIKSFSATSMATVPIEVTIIGKEKIDLLGRVLEATRVEHLIHLPKGDVLEVRHLDDQGRLVRIEGPAAHARVQFVRCDKAFATSKVQSTEDFFAGSYVPCPKPLPVLASRLVLTLKPKGEAKIDVPQTDSQKVETAFDGTVTVTIESNAVAGSQALPYDGSDAAALEALKPTRYVQSDDELIVETARREIGKTGDVVQAVRRLATWVDRRLSSKNLSVGYASASEAIRSREGDCTEHAVLLAALCRAAGVPARTATGMIYVRRVGTQANVFGAHQWTQVHIGGKWRDVDATVAPPYYTIGRIVLGTGLGDESDWSALLGKFGTFEIVEAEIVK
ncbi:MAG: transglutaminase domain-containing protein [Planctomycetes bacterium]|nr:transglutaminase domain-containing protein [Planctomycetota bacterium]